MTRRLAHPAVPIAGGLALLALGTRLHNAIEYPPDWGFDASFNWQYIYGLSRSWSLPDPRAGWATGDPPLFFYLSGAIARILGEFRYALLAIPLMNTAVGLGVAALAVLLVRREEPEDLRRALLAGGLLLFLPAHVYMSAMVNEEMLGALFSSLAVYGLAGRDPAGGERGRELSRAAAVGLVGGLGWLTKLSGALAVATGAAVYALDGWRRRALRPTAIRIAVLLLVAAAAGGWFYARNRILYGFFQPHGLPAHERMFSMPPGERSIADYLRIPLSTWSDSQLLNRDLLHSVWGSTYATLWFDGHRAFLPRREEGVRRLGTITLLLALLPTVAFGIGIARGVRRIGRGERRPDLPLLLLCALTLAGYVSYTWTNPWFAVVKGTSLLGLCLPFAYYASDVLARWTRRRGIGPLLWVALGALVACSTLSSTFNLAFEKTEISGLPWESPASP